MASEVVLGPYLRLEAYWPEDHKWIASVLVVASLHAVPTQPRVLLKDGEQQPQFPGTLLDSHGDFNFWRFNIDTVLLGTERAVHYFVDLGPTASAGQAWHSFVLPAVSQPWHWAFTSCAAFSSGKAPPPEWGGAAPVWWSLMRSHGQQPLHALLRGGGQINADRIFEEPPIAEWARIGNRLERESAPFSQDMARAAADAYFKCYTQQFGGDGVRQALAAIPQVNMWDDKDIFTLFGSFPTTMQQCPVFKGLFEVARRMYLLFQHHTTGADAARRRTFISDTNLSYIKQLGPATAVIAVDGRSERSRGAVLEPPSWAELLHRAGDVRRGVRHVVVLLPPPLHYPRVPLSDRAAQASSSVVKWDSNSTLTGLLRSAGMGSSAPTLEQGLDGAMDRWAASAHWQERRRLVEQSQALGDERDMRITFLSGGMGAAGVAQFYSFPKEPHVQHDHRWMAQIVAPPSVDRPAGDAATRALQVVSTASQGVNNLTKEKMVRLFGVTHPGLAKLLPRRGWVEAVELPPGNYTPRQEVRATQQWRPAAPPEGIAGKATSMLGRTSTLLKKTYLEARGQDFVDEENKVIVLPPVPGCLRFTLHLEPAPGQTTEMESYDYVVPPFAGQLTRAPSTSSLGSAAGSSQGGSKFPSTGATAAGAAQPPLSRASTAAPPATGIPAGAPGPGGAAPVWSPPAPTPQHQQPDPHPHPEAAYQVPMTYAEVGAPPDRQQQGQQGPQQQAGAAAAAATPVATPAQQPSAQQPPQPQQPSQRPLASVAPLSGSGRGPAGRMPVASDPFDMAAAAAPAAVSGAARPGHPAEQAAAAGDDPFAPGAGRQAASGGSTRYPGIYGAQDASQYVAPVWQPAYGNGQQPAQPPQPPQPHPAAGHPAAGAAHMPEGVSSSYAQAYANYVQAQPQQQPQQHSQQPGGLQEAGHVQPISGGGAGGGNPVAASGCRITAGQQAAGQQPHPPASHSQAPAAQPVPGRYNDNGSSSGGGAGYHGSATVDPRYNKPVPQHSGPAATSGAPASSHHPSAPPPGPPQQQQHQRWTPAPAPGTRPTGPPNTSATMAFLADLQMQDQRKK